MNELKNQIDYIEIFGLDYLWTRIDPKDIIIDGKNITITYRDDYRMEDYHVEIHGENQLIILNLFVKQVDDKYHIYTNIFIIVLIPIILSIIIAVMTNMIFPIMVTFIFMGMFIVLSI